MNLAQIPKHKADHIAKKIAEATKELRRLGKDYHRRGWCLGTSGNFSVVLEHDPLLVLVTASGKDKSQLRKEDFAIVDENATPIIKDGPKPSAEALLHVTAIKHTGAGAVLHTHSVWSTILSEKHFKNRSLTIDGYEMLKGLDGIKTHETKEEFPIFDNSQDMKEFAENLSDKFNENDNNLEWAYLIRKHGMHTWGKTLKEAKRHVEIMEFLLEAQGRLEGGQ